MQSAIIVFPGSNRERDAAVALKRATGREPLHIWHRETEFPEVDLILLPGGFSYGDYLRCGAMAAQSPIMREIKARAAKGVPILGICNGFQILTESRHAAGRPDAQRLGLKFICNRIVTHAGREAAEYDLHQQIRRRRASSPCRSPHADGNAILPMTRRSTRWKLTAKSLSAIATTSAMSAKSTDR